MELALSDVTAKEVDARLQEGGPIRRLVLERVKLGKQTLERLAALSSLEELELVSSGVNAKVLAALLERAAWPTLSRLDLRGNPLGDDGLAALGAASAALFALRDLGLWYTRAREAGIRALAPLRIEKWQSGSDKFGIAEVTALADNDWPLTHLHMGRQKIGAAGVEVLMARAPMTLRVLSLMETGINAKAMKAIAAATRFTLEEARFRYDPIGDDAVETLVAAPCARELRMLQISQAHLGPKSIRALVRSPMAATLEQLYLSTNPRIGIEGVDHFVLGRWPKLRELRIGGTPLGAHGVETLLANEFPALEILDLTHAELDDAAVAQLAKWPGLGRLRELYLGTNQVTDAGLATLGEVPAAAGLQVLDVGQCPCSATAAAAVAATKHLAPKTLHTSFLIRS